AVDDEKTEIGSCRLARHPERGPPAAVVPRGAGLRNVFLPAPRMLPSTGRGIDHGLSHVESLPPGALGREQAADPLHAALGPRVLGVPQPSVWPVRPRLRTGILLRTDLEPLLSAPG